MARSCWCSTPSCSPGDNFVAARRLYGGSINQFGHAFKNFAWEVRWADPHDPASFESQIDEKTRGIFIESLANPGGEFVDIEKIGDIARTHGLPLIVDNTLATPYLVRPIEHGADIVVHSLTKFIGGHGNSMGGAIVDGGTFNWSKSGNYPMLSEPRPEYGGVVLHETFGNFAFAIACRVLGLRDLGPAISPFNAFLILTGLETLPLRMQRHCDNALAVAEWLSKHPKVAWVSYPGLPSDKNHAHARTNIRRSAPARCSPSASRAAIRRRHQAGGIGRAVLASRQCRRHQIADHPSGLDHAPPACRTSRRSRPAPGRTWCGCRSASRMSGHHRRSGAGAGEGLRRRAGRAMAAKFLTIDTGAVEPEAGAPADGPADFRRSEIPHLECRGGRRRPLCRHLGSDAGQMAHRI